MSIEGNEVDEREAERTSDGEVFVVWWRWSRSGLSFNLSKKRSEIQTPRDE